MKYHYPSRYKKFVKNLGRGIKYGLKTKNFIKNPIKESINTLIDKASKLDTKRKGYGIYKNRKQTYNPKLKRFIKINSETNKFMKVRKEKGKPFKNIEII